MTKLILSSRGNLKIMKLGCRLVIIKMLVTTHIQNQMRTKQLRLTYLNFQKRGATTQTRSLMPKTTDRYKAKKEKGEPVA